MRIGNAAFLKGRGMAIDDKFKAYPGCYDGGGGVWANVIPAEEMAVLRRDAERWQWAAVHCATQHTHSDGMTHFWLSKYIGCGISIEDAVDNRIAKEKEAAK